jgi:zinc/manganese transport system substrate-binding protein
VRILRTHTEETMKKIFSLLLALCLPLSAAAKLNVVTTIPDIAAMVKEIGGSEVSVESIAKGSQDPHFIEAKPSYMVKASRADLFLSMGLDLEIGWVPPILAGARNPRVMPGQPGYLELGTLIEAIDKPTGSISRANGDVHPHGNPHFNLDPIRWGQAAEGVGARMGELDPAHAEDYKSRASAFRKRLEEKTKSWKERIRTSGVEKVVTFHPTLNYFLDRFGLELAATLEPKPGIPPTTKHLLEVIDLVKEKKVPVILVENFFDPSAADKIVKEVPGTRVVQVPVLVQGVPGIETTADLMETLVKAVEGQ